MNWFQPNFNSIQNLCFYTKICFLLLLSNLHLYTYMPINLDFNYCFIPLYFKSDRKQRGVRNKKYNNTGFYIYLSNYIYWDSLFYQVDLSYWLASIHLAQRTAISISCRSGLLVTNSLIICLSVNLLISLSLFFFWMDF